MESKPAYRLTEIGVIAALYTVLTLVLPVASFGPIQVRLSEALTVLPAVTASAIPGLTLGCFLANLIGLSVGANAAGAWDLLLGTAATLGAAALSYGFRSVQVKGLPLLSLLPPILLNGLVVGSELCFVTLSEPPTLVVWLIFVGEVAGGEGLSAGIGGGLLFLALRTRRR